MHTEYEATFFPIEIDEMRSVLEKKWAICVRPMYTQVRTTMELPAGHETLGSFVRVRDGWDHTTMTWKHFSQDGNIESQSEIEVEVSSYDHAILLLEKIWCTPKAMQESRRELRALDWVSIMIDERPFLEPFVEIEWSWELQVKKIAQDLWFDRHDALFDSVTPLYAQKYWVSQAYINDEVPEIRFDGENPFLV